MSTGYFDQPSTTPLVSVVWCGKNHRSDAEKTIQSVLRQSYRQLELIVEDGGSTDGTLEWLRGLARSDARISIVSQAFEDEGSALLVALRRCKGDYVVICTPGQEFANDALQFSVAKLSEFTDVGALAFRGLLRDRDGAPSLKPFDLVTLLFAPVRLALAGGVIRRQALFISGLQDDNWRTACFRLDLWSRLAMDHQIANIDRQIATGALPLDDSGFPLDMDRVVEARNSFITAMFSDDGFFTGGDDSLRDTCIANQLGILREEYGALTEEVLRPYLRQLTFSLCWLIANDRKAAQSIDRLLTFWAAHKNLQALPGYLRLLRPFHRDDHDRTIRLLAWLSKFAKWASWPMLKAMMTAPSKVTSELDEQAVTASLAPIYANVADRHHEHGQIENALKAWRKCEILRDSNIEGTALQAILKLPSATEQSISELHMSWGERHVAQHAHVDPLPLLRPINGRKLRIGYHCSFMHVDTMRYMMGNVVAAHDRDQFEVYGYSPLPVPQDIARGFDVIRDTSTTYDDPSHKMFHGTPAMSDEAFVDLVRADKLDVFMELTGFSPGHRFVAMASRCAPVQISFMNHTASSQVANVDYILADELGLPSNQQIEQYYSEKIYRMPGSFFCFDYRIAPHPEVSPPPSLEKKFVTFGCFGFGGKFNSKQLEIWAGLLRNVPGSRLWLQNNQMQAEFRRLLLGKFRNLGIDDHRITLAAGASRDQLLDTFKQIDISLDSWPYCGGNTIAEALWMGLPVVTLYGDRFSSRYGASLLAAAGCSDLVAESPEEYIAIATKLATDPARLVFLRNNLRAMSLRHGLGDSALFARRLEAAYREMLAALTEKRVAAPVEAVLSK